MLEKLQLEHPLKPVPNEGYLEVASQEGYPACPCGYHIGTEAKRRSYARSRISCLWPTRPPHLRYMANRHSNRVMNPCTRRSDGRVTIEI